MVANTSCARSPLLIQIKFVLYEYSTGAIVASIGAHKTRSWLLVSGARLILF